MKNRLLVGLPVFAAGLLCFVQSSPAADAVQVSVKPLAQAAEAGGLYLANRPPLQPTAFMKLPVGSITPRGWLRQQLELDARGLVGRLPEISPYLKFEGNGWVEPNSNQGWEEMPYWLRGYGDLGYVLKDERIIANARKWIEGILSNQKPDGYFGPERLRTAESGFPDLWPHMLLLDVLHSFYEYTGDERVPKFMLNYFRWQNTQAPEAFKHGWGAVRWADNLAIVYWLYNKTGEAWLLDLGRKVHENSLNYTTSIPTWHNVNLSQGIREPAEYWLQAGDAKFLNATELNYEKIMGLYGQFAGGGFAGDENCRPGYRDPRQGFETCGWVEFMHTFEMMTRISGNPLWADRAEEIAFNSYPAAMEPEHTGTHYITCANSIQLDKVGKRKGQFANGDFVMLPFKAGVTAYRCCPHNLGMGWPYYAEELWLATADHGLCASLYAASEVKAKVADGADITITEETQYPFADEITLRLKLAKSADFPLYLRVPRWCSSPEVRVNGKPLQVRAVPLSYLVLRHTWSDGDVVTLRLPMHVAVRTWAKNQDAVSVDYGPLTFSLDIKERWSRYGGSEAWPEYEVFPESPWNYGLQLNPKSPAADIRVERLAVKPGSNPFTHEGAPLALRVKARRIPNWQADSDNVVGTLHPSPVRSSEPVETVRLIPMGAARLRVTTFPTIGTGADAHEWSSPQARSGLSASHTFGSDSVEAMMDGLEPATSADDTIPRFTWWDHRGTTEWVQCDFTAPRPVKGVAVYWFDDTGKGGCRVPKSWKVLYQSGGAWKPVETAEAPGTARDRYNRVSFQPVNASALRLEVELQPGFSGGVLEWKVE